MNFKTFLPVIFILSFIQLNSQVINFVSNKTSSYKIIIPVPATQWDSAAASRLQYYIKEISGFELPVLNSTSPITDNEIVIGKCAHSAGMDISTIHDKDGYLIKTIGNRIYIIGGNGKGALNAVDTFLEKYLNCRVYSSKVKIIPKQSCITLPQIDINENPVFSYRSIYYTEASNDDYCLWHKLVDSNDKKEWGMFVHTFNQLLPPERYFKEHPEYYALRDTIRVPEQPCLSNPDVFKIVVNELRKRMNENPGAVIWSVSQNDNFSYCQCPACRKIDELAGSHSGSIINFVNKVAREFPDKIISTLAYEFSRKAPKRIVPEKNVNIMLCSIESYRTKPLDADTSSESFAKDLADWAKLTDNIFIWDYVVQFTNYVSPFPNFQVLQPNIQLFAKYGVKMIFEQGAARTDGAEFSELRTYLIAKLLWNPYINIDSVMNDFLNGYYGNAGKIIRGYIDLITANVNKTDAQLWIYSNPVESMKDYLAPDMLKAYYAIFEKALDEVKNNPLYLERVKSAMLPVEYAMLEQAKVIGTGAGGIFLKDSNGNFKPNPFIVNMLNEFSKTCTGTGHVFINEKSLDADTYVSRYKTVLSKTMYNPVGLFKPVKYITAPGDKYPANGTKSLTDGLHGDEDHHFNWQGFEGSDMDVVVDLLSEQVIHKVSLDFLQIIFSWIFLPESVKISFSDNGTNFNRTVVINNVEPLDKDGAFIHKFTAELNSVKARYIRVEAVSIKNCPRWHTGYPGKAWIFCDEIVVE